MPPRGTVNCDPETGGRLNGRAEVQQVLRREKGTITTGSRTHQAHRLAGRGSVASIPAAEIPWRTSRRLQEATLRLIKERDGGHSHSQVSMEEEDDFQTTESIPPARSPIRPLSESEFTGEQEDQPAEVPAEECGSPSVAESEQTSSAAETGTTSVRARRKAKRRKVQFNDDLHLTHEDNKAIASISSNAHDKDAPNHVSPTPATACRWNRTAGGKVERTVAGSENPTNTVIKQPQSCFDLLCSHVGYRGWRCYRSRVVGQAFCVYHTRESTPVSGICLYT